MKNCLKLHDNKFIIGNNVVIFILYILQLLSHYDIVQTVQAVLFQTSGMLGQPMRNIIIPRGITDLARKIPTRVHPHMERKQM